MTKLWFIFAVTMANSLGCSAKVPETRRPSVPQVTQQEKRIERLLSQANRLEIRGELVTNQQGGFVVLAEFGKGEFPLLLSGFRFADAPTTSQRPQKPYVWFCFFQGKHELAECLVSLNKPQALFFDSAATSMARSWKLKPLRPSTANHFWHFLQSHPQLLKELKASPYLT